MKDAFGEELTVGDRVMFSLGNVYGTTYTIGKVSKLYEKEQWPYNRVSISVERCTYDRHSTKEPIVLSVNVVKLTKNL